MLVVILVAFWSVFTSSSASESTLLDDLTTLVGEDACSPQINLTRSLKLGNDVIDSLYVCQNGYVSLGNSTPDILTSPGDYNSALNATIMAPGLMKNNETSVELIGAYYGELDDPSDWDGEDDEDDDDEHEIDPYFLPEFAFMAVWIAVDSNANVTRLVSLVLACDTDYPTTEGKSERCAMLMLYDTLVDVQDPSTSAFMRTGVYSPSGVILELPYSGTENVTLLASESNVNDPGFWLYEMDQKYSSGDIIKTYVRSDCNTFADKDLPDNCKIGAAEKHLISIGMLWLLMVFHIAQLNIK
ncbi:uncharacterized protein LOC142338558 [Convolutriloba macropyga]|uniref:uncharacterized protein LOC142338558 n=1 Tax=Convolutriloba macropyga TaxID=536237 RepID=UPI003F5277EB